MKRTSYDFFESKVNLKQRQNGLWQNKLRRHSNARQLFTNQCKIQRNLNKTVKQLSFRTINPNPLLNNKFQNNKGSVHAAEIEKQSISTKRSTNYLLFNPRLPQLSQVKSHSKSISMGQNIEANEQKSQQIPQKPKKKNNDKKIPDFIKQQILKSQSNESNKAAEPLHLISLQLFQKNAFETIQSFKNKSRQRQSYRIRRKKHDNLTELSVQHQSRMKKTLYDFKGPQVISLVPSQQRYSKKIEKKPQFFQMHTKINLNLKKNFLQNKQGSIKLEGWHEGQNLSDDYFDEL